MEKTFLQRHSVSIYFFLVFLISWLGSFLAVGPKFLQGEVIDLKDIGLMGIAMLSGPFIAGILMTSLTDGREGLNELFTLMTKMGNWSALVCPAGDFSNSSFVYIVNIVSRGLY